MEIYTNDFDDPRAPVYTQNILPILFINNSGEIPFLWILRSCIGHLPMNSIYGLNGIIGKCDIDGSYIFFQLIHLGGSDDGTGHKRPVIRIGMFSLMAISASPISKVLLSKL